MKLLQDQSVLILGLGDSGLAMARWCVRCGAQVHVIDTRAAPPQLAVLQAELPQVRFSHGAFDAQWIDGQAVRAVFKSPGLSPAAVAPLWQAAQAAGLWTGTELSLFAQALADLRDTHAYHPQVLAITGTNGKTTVTSLTGQLLARAGWRVAVAGNIGPTLLDTLAQSLDTAEAQAATAAAEVQAAAAPAETPEPVAHAVDPIATAPMQDDPTRDTDASADDHANDPAEADDDGPAPLVPPPPPPPDHPWLPQAWVLELSSFQLDGVSHFEPTAATVLNLTQDHLDWHGDMAAYGAAKARIFGAQGLLVLNREDPAVMAMLPEPVRAKLQKPQWRAHQSFGADVPQRPGDWGIETVNGMTWLVRALQADETRKRRKDEEEEIHIQRLMPADALRIRGRHNALNALAALALASSTGAPLAPMLYGLREYRGEPHRVEPVAMVREVEFIDDSKGTNVGATVAALQGLGAERRLVVILGGDGKGQDFSPLAEPVQRHARAVVLIGQDAERLQQVLAPTGVTVLRADSLPEAVQCGFAQAQAGDAVLLSPACASMDMFRHYAHRAEVFVQAVQALAQQEGAMA